MHKHHIIPKYMGGTDDPSNLIELSVSDHANAHYELWLMCGNWQDEVAWKGLSGMISSTEAIRQSQSLANKGKKLSKETREAMKKAWKTRPSATVETRKKSRDALARRKERGDTSIVAGNTGKKQSEYQREIVSKYWTGRKRSPEQIELMRANAKAQWARRRTNEKNKCL